MGSAARAVWVAKRAGGRVAIGLGLGAVVVVLGLAVVWIERRPIGARLIVEYFGRRGVPAHFSIARLDADGLSGALIVGRRDDPDLTVERLDIVLAPFSLDGLAPRIARIRLLRPDLRARFDGRTLSFGALQPLIAAGGAAGGGPSPAIVIEAGRLRLESPGGRLVLAGDGVLEEGHIASASARIVSGAFGIAGVKLESPGGGVRLASSKLTSGPPHLHATWRLDAVAVEVGSARAQGVDLQGDVDAPTQAPGALHAEVTLRSHNIVRASAGAILRRVVARLELAGAMTMSSHALGFAGAASVVAKAAVVGSGPATAADATITVRSSRLSLASGARLDAPFDLDLGVRSARIDAGGRSLKLSGLGVRGGGRARFHAGEPFLAFTGAAQARGELAPQAARRLAAAIIPAAAGSAARHTVAESLAGFAFDATRWALIADAGRLDLALVAPLRAQGDGGAVATLSGAPATSLLRLAHGVASGGFTLRLAGSGLPTSTASVARYRLSADTGGSKLDAAATVDLDGDLGPLHGLSLQAHGVVARHAGRLVVLAPECAALGLAAVAPPDTGPSAEPGAAPFGLRDVRLQVCPTSSPLLTLADGRWRVAAQIKAASARLAGVEVDVGADDARIDLQGRAAPDAGYVALAGVHLRDAGPTARFHLLFADGSATLGAEGWRGAADVAFAPGLSAFAHAQFSHDPRDGVGGATLEATTLRFSPKALQPAQIVAAAAPWLSQVEGVVDVSAQAAWRGRLVTSAARVHTEGLDLRSSAGLLTGLRGDVRFVSLSPLTTAPRQRLRADALATLLPLKDLDATFDLDQARLSLRDAGASLAGGRAHLDPMTFTLTPSAPNSRVSDSGMAGALRLEGVNADTLIGVLNLSNSVSMQARMNGVLPFALGPQGLRLSQGRLAAIGPGRLTIRRQALTAAMATAGGAGAQPGAVQDFAYQALEDLAFDTLDAAIASRPQGRLGVVLHVKGRHDPPVATVTRVRVSDLLRGHAFDKPLPLPKGTAIDLTLDTSLNFDELLADYGGLRFQTGPAGAQPAKP